MNKIMLVDDDEFVRRMYEDALTQSGFRVDTAGDGLEATRLLETSRPDLIVLDLMMPRFNGVDFLKYLRGLRGFADLPVVVLSNSYMDELARKAIEIGVQYALLKIRCSPPVLIALINELLGGVDAKGGEADIQLAIPEPVPKTAARRLAAPDPADATTNQEAQVKFDARARKEFLASAAKTLTDIRSLHQAFTQARNDAERGMRLHTFYRKMHFVTMAAGMAQCHRIALLASAFEALLFEVMNKSAYLTPSVLRTTAFTVNFFGTLFDHARDASADEPLTARVLVVDDDPVSNRLVTAALRHAKLEAHSTENPVMALGMVEQQRFDLLLLDIEMPELDGFELCRTIRATPGYDQTPVVYVTSHSDFDSRSRSVLSGGNDLIAKPVFPLELAVKSVTHLVHSQLLQ